MILIKDNHIKAAGGIGNAVKKARRKISKKTKIEVEVSNLKELHEAVSVKPDIIMFDNWNPQGLKNALKLLPGNIYSEASGQISIDNIKKYAVTGVDYISTSYFIKHSNWIDFSLEEQLL